MRVTILRCLPLALGVVVSTTGCKSVDQSSPSLQDLVNDQSCSRTCWQGIEPGTTTQEEAVRILDALPGEYSDVFPDFPGRRPQDAIYEWLPPSDGAASPIRSVEVPIADGFVYTVSILVEVCAATIVDDYGEPPIVHEHGSTFVLTYPQENLMFSVHGSQGNLVQRMSILTDEVIEAYRNGDYMRDWEIRERFFGECTDSFS